MVNEKPKTRLSGKEYSPLIIRRYSMPFLHWVAIICDSDLSELDDVVDEWWLDYGDQLEKASIQTMRNMAGSLCNAVVLQWSPVVEGVAVIFSADKMLVSSLAGDFMVHEQCRLELYSLLNLSTQV